jgi:hypothetical protein
VAFAPDSKMFCTSAHDFTAKTWDFDAVRTVVPSGQITKHASNVVRVAHVPNKPAVLLSIAEDGQVCLIYFIFFIIYIIS